MLHIKKWLRVSFSFVMLAGVFWGGAAHAAWFSNYNPGRVLFLEHSIVDLEHNIEILKFNWTQGQDFCDVYASVYGVKRTTNRCQNYQGYTTPKFTSANGWRIGDGSEIQQVFALMSGAWTPSSSAIYSYSNSATTPAAGLTFDSWVSYFDSDHIFSGRPSFLANTIRNSTPSSTMITQIDWTPNNAYAGSLRLSQSGLSGSQADVSTLLVRDWLGYERALYTVNTPLWLGVLSLVGGLCWGRRTRQTIR